MKKKNLILLISSIVLSLIIGEFIVIFSTKILQLPINIPKYKKNDDSTFTSFWADVNEDFGVWHVKKEYRSTTSCFDVVYKSNSFGARDKERVLKGKEDRIIVIGDSFVEGIGVEDEERITDLLEKDTGIEHLNFGTAGNFGPLQYSILYDKLAKNFSHNGVIVGILPDNDFTDDDYNFGKKYFGNRYRPYLIGKDGNYKIIYYLDEISKSKWSRKVDAETGVFDISEFFRNYSYTYNLIEYLIEVQKYKLAEKELVSWRNRMENKDSWYYKYSEDGLRKMVYSLNNIKNSAGDRELLVILFPRHPDFKTYQTERSSPLGESMRKEMKKIGVNFIDLLPLMYPKDNNSWKKYFHSCDGHFSVLGNEIAENAIIQSDTYQSFIKKVKTGR